MQPRHRPGLPRPARGGRRRAAGGPPDRRGAVRRRRRHRAGDGEPALDPLRPRPAGRGRRARAGERAGHRDPRPPAPQGRLEPLRRGPGAAAPRPVRRGGPPPRGGPPAAAPGHRRLPDRPGGGPAVAAPGRPRSRRTLMERAEAAGVRIIDPHLLAPSTPLCSRSPSGRATTPRRPAGRPTGCAGWTTCRTPPTTHRCSPRPPRPRPAPSHLGPRTPARCWTARRRSWRPRRRLAPRRSSRCAPPRPSSPATPRPGGVAAAWEALGEPYRAAYAHCGSPSSFLAAAPTATRRPSTWHRHGHRAPDRRRRPGPRAEDLGGAPA